MKFQSGLDVSTQHRAQSGRYSYKMKHLYYLRIYIVPQYFKLENHEFKDFKHFMKTRSTFVFGPTG